MKSHILAFVSCLFLFTRTYAQTCETNTCITGYTGTESIKLTCGKKSQQIIMGVWARAYDASVSDSFVSNCTSSYDDWTTETAANTCQLGNYLANKCDAEMDCEFDIAEVLAQFQGQDCGNLAIADIDTIDVFLDCGDPGTDPLTLAVLLMLFFVALAMGTTTTVDDFRYIMKGKKKAFAIGFASQYAFMPTFSYVAAVAMGFSSLESFGIVLCGMAPGGSTSNLFTYWADGNVALSIAMSAASTTCSFFMIPLLYAIFIQSTFASDVGVELPIKNLVVVLLVIIIPVSLGIWIRNKNITVNCGCSEKTKAWKLHTWIEKIGSGIGALFLVVSLFVGVAQNSFLFEEFGDYWKTWLLAFWFQPIGCAFGFGISKMLGMNTRDARAISLETGVQNYAVSLAIVVLSLEGCDRAEALSFVLVAMALYLVHSPLAVVLLKTFTTVSEEEEKEAAASKKGSNVVSPA
eukprot:g1815.t1